MLTDADIRYRILQTGLSRFSIHLNKADSLTDISKCLLQNTKYLYNYTRCRFHYISDDQFVCYTITLHQGKVETGAEHFLNETEQEVFDTGIPYYQKKVVNDGEEDAKGDSHETWIWRFKYKGEAGILVTIEANEMFAFSQEQIPLVKITSEMLYTKTRMVLLLTDLEQKQETLMVSYKKIEEKNTFISNLVVLHEKTIEQRTRALRNANTKLVELIQFHSHNVREPLTRVMGLLNLYTIVSQEEFFNDCWPMLEKSVDDMDKTIKEIIIKTEKIEVYESLGS